MSKTRFLLSRTCGSSFVAYCARMVDQMSKTCFLYSCTCGYFFIAYYARMVDQMSKNCFLLSRACEYSFVAFKQTNLFPLKEEPQVRDNKKRVLDIYSTIRAQ
jgi:hypothetical protein